MIRSLIRRPLESSHDHFAVRDPNAQADFLLRTWPDPRCFRRGWSEAQWLELDPPLLAWRALIAQGRNAPFEPRPRSTRGRRPGAGQADLGLPDPDARLRRGGLDGFWNAVPSEVRDRLRRLPHRQWRALQVSALDPALTELLQTNLALVVALTALDRFVRRFIPDSATLQRDLARRRQHEALSALGFPGRRGVRRLLQRVHPEAITVEALLQFRNALHQGAADLPLGHLDSINAGALALASDETCRQHLSSRLLHEVADDEGEISQATAAYLLRDAVWMMRELGRSDARFRPRTVRRLRDTHDALHADLRLHRHRRDRRREPQLPTPVEPEPRRARPQAPAQIAPREATPFPDPPIPEATGRFGVRTRALRTEKELRAWGNTQRNCAGSYADRIRAGADYLYAVEAPQRATLGLVCSPASPGGWRMQQLLGRRNRPVSKATMVAVRAWVLESLDARLA